MKEVEESLTHIDAIQRRMNLKMTAQAEMRWLMGRMLAQLLTKQLPKGFTCKYVKNGEVGWNKGEADSDEFLISDSRNSVWARIHTGYILSRQIPNMRVNENNGYGESITSPDNLQLLKVLKGWAEEFQLTANLELPSDREKALAAAKFERASRLNRRREARRKTRQLKTK